MIDLPVWDAGYPDPAAVRAEVEAMAHAVRDVVVRELGDEQLRGVYHKGSGHKAWDTPLDYVPELSDVDVHIWLRDTDADALLRDLEGALRVGSAIEFTYRHSVPAPEHMPRPQVLVLNRLWDYDDYVPSPAPTVEVLYGEPYPRTGVWQVDEVRAIDRANLRKMNQETADFGLSAIDKPGRHAWSAVRALTWRVSPTGTRALTVLGMRPDEAWLLNRTGVVRALEARGQDELAKAIRDYYVAGWGYFRSGFQDAAQAHAVMRHALAVIRLGARVARDTDAAAD